MHKYSVVCILVLGMLQKSVVLQVLFYIKYIVHFPGIYCIDENKSHCCGWIFLEFKAKEG
jgi:hypothetical protein